MAETPKLSSILAVASLVTVFKSALELNRMRRDRKAFLEDTEELQSRLARAYERGRLREREYDNLSDRLSLAEKRKDSMYWTHSPKHMMLTLLEHLLQRIETSIEWIETRRYK